MIRHQEMIEQKMHLAM
jgi:hypothetical protein